MKTIIIRMIVLGTMLAMAAFNLIPRLGFGL